MIPPAGYVINDASMNHDGIRIQLKLPKIAVCLLGFAAIVLGSAAVRSGVDNSRFGANGSFRLQYSYDGFGTRSHGIVESVNGREIEYPLPQSTFEAFAKLRPDDRGVYPLKADDYERMEVIGPHQSEGNKLWFGNNFYDGEGMRGVGAFGYFDTETRQYLIFSPPEIARFEISAILVEPDSVWLGLDHFGEDISTSPGGLVCWDRTTHQARRYPLEFVVTAITHGGESLHLATEQGFALFRDGAVERFALRKTPSGKTEWVPVGKFAPPPSIQ